jgi:hypothetical protein
VIRQHHAKRCKAVQQLTKVAGFLVGIAGFSILVKVVADVSAFTYDVTHLDSWMTMSSSERENLAAISLLLAAALAHTIAFYFRRRWECWRLNNR